MRGFETRVAKQHAGEHGRTHRAQIEGRRADVAETHRREIPFADRLDEAARTDGVDVESGEAVELAVALDVAVVDIIVAEGAEVEIVEAVLGIAGAVAGRSVTPERGVLPGQRPAGARIQPGLGEEGAARVIRAEHAAQVIALFVVDGAQRLVNVVVVERELQRAQAGRARGHVLRAGQRVEAGIEFEIGGEIEPARRIVDQRLGVAAEQGIALAAAVDGSEQVVEIGAVVPVAHMPVERAIGDIGMKLLAARDVARRRIGDVGGQLVVAQRIAEIGVETEGGVALVAHDGGIEGLQAQFVARDVFAAAGDHRLQRNLRRRPDRPGLHDGIGVGDLGAEEADIAQIVERLGIDAHGQEALPRVLVDDQRAVAHRQRTEEAGHGVAHRFDLSGRQFEAVDVGDAGVIGGGVEIFAVGREHAAFGHGGIALQGGDLGDDAGLQIGDAEHADALIAIDLADRGREILSVGRDIEIEQGAAIGESMDQLPAVMLRPDADQ